MQRFRGSYVSHKSSGKKGVIQNISPAWVSVLWDDPEHGALRESFRRGNVDALAQLELMTADKGWIDAVSVLASKDNLNRAEVSDSDEGAVYVQESQVASLLGKYASLLEGKGKSKKDCDCGCEDCNERDKKKEEDYLSPAAKDKTRRGPDPKEFARYARVLKGSVGEAAARGVQAVDSEDLMREWQEVLEAKAGRKRKAKVPPPGSKEHSPHKNEPVLGKGADNKWERTEKQKYSCAKDPAELGLSDEDVKKAIAKEGGIQPYKQFCVKVDAEDPASTIFTVNKGKKGYMKRYNKEYKKCVNAARSAKKKPPRTRADGKPNCGPAYKGKS
jgi:hypothetical protein